MFVFWKKKKENTKWKKQTTQIFFIWHTEDQSSRTFAKYPMILEMKNDQQIISFYF